MAEQDTQALSTQSKSRKVQVEHLKSRLFKVVCLGAALVGFAALTLLLADIIWEAYVAVTDFGIDIIQFLISPGSTDPTSAGILAAVIGSLWLMILTALFTFGIGVGAAIYLEEFAPENRWKRVIEINLANLAGVPSVVYGLVILGLMIHVLGFDAIIIVGAIALSLTVMPIVIVSTQEALRAVPDSMREASDATGATQWQTVRNVVLPAAMPGILTGMILGLADAWGQTAPIIMVGTLVGARHVPWTPFDRNVALTATIFEWSFSFEPGFRAIAALGIVILLIILLAMNGIAIYLRHRYETAV